ncbi:hypothetical protein M1B34_13175 [Pseudomonas sp. MAFF 302030]|uniref:Uncharacterized protein n=1 Tax=Pseudomonas morbosilactucae TaxID=2938197 RepID=A0A9X1YVF7_9PSED|nr:hypothetical protein [Pseudomonas morbosilactucae]MCK9798649.1 hypothetical protein [Pseudomonas morbosilactucae]
MVIRLAVVLLFLYSTPILSAAEPAEGEPDAPMSVGRAFSWNEEPSAGMKGLQLGA